MSRDFSEAADQCARRTPFRTRLEGLSTEAAFSLVEVILALAVAAFGLIAIFGLLPTGLNSNQASTRQTAAADILAGIIADLRQTPTANVIAAAAPKVVPAVSPRLGIDLTQAASKGYLDQSGALTPAGAASLAASSPTGQSYYQLNITIINPPPATQPSPPVRTATKATIQISWPAQAQTANAAGSLISFVALDRN